MATIHLPSDFKEFLKLLSAHQVEYLLIGGYVAGTGTWLTSKTCHKLGSPAHPAFLFQPMRLHTGCEIIS